MNNQKLLEYHGDYNNWSSPPAVIQPAPEDEEKNKGGRPEHEPTPESRRKVIKLASRRLTYDTIAIAMDMHRNTLKKHYAAELEEGRARHEVQFTELVWKQMENGDGAMIRWWDATRNGRNPNRPQTEEELEGNTTMVIELIDAETPDKERNEL